MSKESVLVMTALRVCTGIPFAGFRSQCRAIPESRQTCMAAVIVTLCLSASNTPGSNSVGSGLDCRVIFYSFQYKYWYRPWNWPQSFSYQIHNLQSPFHSTYLICAVEKRMLKITKKQTYICYIRWTEKIGKWTRLRKRVSQDSCIELENSCHDRQYRCRNPTSLEP
jgi:hypothetical protein